MVWIQSETCPSPRRCSLLLKFDFVFAVLLNLTLSDPIGNTFTEKASLERIKERANLAKDARTIRQEDPLGHSAATSGARSWLFERPHR